MNYTEAIQSELKKGDRLAVERKQEALKGKSTQTILNELLSQIKPVDFQDQSNQGNDGKIARKLYVIITIDKIKETATLNNWGLCTRNGFIYVFNGKYWQVVSVDDFKPFLAEAAKKMGVPAIEAKYFQFKDDLYKQFLSESNLPTLETKRNTLINLLNGTFDFSSEGKQELREHRREDFLKYQLPFEYNPDADCPLFYRYLNRVLVDEDCQKVLAEYLGYLFINDLKLEKALILFGYGANGKSVLFDIVNAILGEENICSYSLQNLTKPDGYQRAELANKLLNYCSEINGKLDASIFKQLTSGEQVEARQIYGKPFIMREYAKLAFNCNELPKEVEQTHAFFRRFIIIPFDQTIPESEQDPALSKKIIQTELSGVFNWILEGLKRLLKQEKFTGSVVVKQQLEDYRRESDSVTMFFDEEGYQPTVDDWIPYKTVYIEYRTYCTENGYRSCSAKTFSERLKRTGFQTKRNNQGNVIYAKK